MRELIHLVSTHWALSWLSFIILTSRIDSGTTVWLSILGVGFFFY